MQRKNIKSSNGRATNIYKGIPIRLSADFFSTATLSPEESGKKYLQ